MKKKNIKQAEPSMKSKSEMKKGKRKEEYKTRRDPENIQEKEK